MDKLRTAKSVATTLGALSHPIVASIVVALITGVLCFLFLQFLNNYMHETAPAATAPSAIIQESNGSPNSNQVNTGNGSINNNSSPVAKK